MLLLGANGRTGREIIKLSLQASNPITAVVRSKGSLNDITHPLLEVIEADAANAEQLKPIISHHDTIISTLGPKTPRQTDCTIYSKSATAITNATNDQSPKRLLIVSTALLFPNNSLLNKILGFIARHNVAHAKLMEDSIKSSALDWTIARVGFLTNKPSDGYHFLTGSMPEESNSISRAALAHFLFNAATERKYSKQIVGLCDKKLDQPAKPLTKQL